MNNKRIAKILYTLSLDMDYADSLEYMNDEMEEFYEDVLKGEK